MARIKVCYPLKPSSLNLSLPLFLGVFFIGGFLIVRFNLYRNDQYALNRSKELSAGPSQPKSQEQYWGLSFEKQKQRLEALRNSGRMSQQEYQERINLILAVQENAMIIDSEALR